MQPLFSNPFLPLGEKVSSLFECHPEVTPTLTAAPIAIGLDVSLQTEMQTYQGLLPREGSNGTMKLSKEDLRY